MKTSTLDVYILVQSTQEVVTSYKVTNLVKSFHVKKKCQRTFSIQISDASKSDIELLIDQKIKGGGLGMVSEERKEDNSQMQENL